MDRKKHFEKHYAKLSLEAWFNSFLLGGIVGLFSGFAAALTTYFLTFNGIILAILVFLGVTVLATPLFYFVKFRPNVVKNARRLDRLGLEERLVTMVEYESDTSYIAELQRNDAKKNLAKLDSSKIKLRISKAFLILIIVSASLFTVMTTLEALDVAGVLPGGDDIIDEVIPEEQIQYFEVIYDVDGGGYIYGEAEQLVAEGGQTLEIVAVADDGWEFVEWEDGYKKPARIDKNITEDILFIAIFAQTGEGDQESDQQDPNSENDKPSDKPQKPQEQDKENQEDNESESENEQKPDEETESEKGGSKYQEANQVIDGETYYKDALNSEYLDKLRERLEKEGDQLTEEERYIIEYYLGIV